MFSVTVENHHHWSALCGVDTKHRWDKSHWSIKSNACVNVVCFGLTLPAASGCGAVWPLVVWLSSYSLGCFLLEWLNKFIMLPSDVRTVSVQTLQITFVCTLSLGGKAESIHIMEVEFLLETNSSIWMSAMPLHASHINKGAGKKARHCL